MLEVLAVATGVELGKLVLGQVLDLGKAALEDYVKDFFKDCIQSGVARAHAETLKKPMAEAIGYFIQQFIGELQFHNVPDTSIDHHYKAAIKRFVQDKTVSPILGKAFEKDCKQIDYQQLEQIWTQQYQADGWRFPAEEFDWRGVAREYVKGVKGIIKADAELRSFLNTELLEDIARNTAQLSPGFDVVKYRESLQCSYGYLKLYTLDSTDRANTIKLWSMFIEQTVREALPPMRYELPLDLKRQLQEQGQLDDLSPEALEHYRREYFEQPARKVLEAVAEVQHAVILGDPGAGKSSLLQYLALNWVEGEAEPLPLLIELREYVLAQSTNFLEFLHRGRGADWQFDQQQLHQHLLENPTLVMFDGLDEVFDRPTQSTVIDDIIRFTQQYPQAKVLVTSRIIGYNPERFQHARFQQFTIQPLDKTEIHEFIDRWYDLAMGSDSDKIRLKQRLKYAIANSKAIANLADNPLLLTMMAILNRRQELPRDRADLYDQASRVLLYHWDVDHKRLQLPMDAIGRREKQEMLRLIAYEMQAGEEGLKGNLIGVDRLTRILTDYLRDQGFSEPREKANQLIQQLRERNFILCYRGADTYGFVHRTFLEYFCAVEIVNRFEKVRLISFEELRDEVFGKHWQDETWHEVLRLICGMIDAKFVGQLIEFLVTQKGDDAQDDLFYEKEIGNLLLATEFLIEVQNRSTITAASNILLDSIKQKVVDPSIRGGEIESVRKLANIVESGWGKDSSLLDWLKSCLGKEHFKKTHTRYFAISAITQGWGNVPHILPILKSYIELGDVWSATRVAAKALVQGWKDDVTTLLFLKDFAQRSNPYSRGAALEALVQGWKDDPDTLSLLKEAQNDENRLVRGVALQALGENWKDDPNTLLLIKTAACMDEDWQVRGIAVELLIQRGEDTPDISDLLLQIAIGDPYSREADFEQNPRQLAIQGLVSFYPTHPKTIELLHDRAINDPDEQLREWAHQQLEKMKGEGQ
ncbi:MAG: hypothetical protein Kow00121_12370 [Elainellaceae cyanobacterium]